MLARLKERFETDISDAELQRVLDNANEDVLNQWGSHADAGTPLTVLLVGGANAIFLDRPITVITSVTETVSGTGGFGETTTVLAADDYRIWFDGRALTRLFDGTNPRTVWGSRVEVVYVPLDDNNQRQEVILKMSILDLQYTGVKQERIGDYSATYYEHQMERQKLVNSLRPKGKMGVA